MQPLSSELLGSLDNGVAESFADFLLGLGYASLATPGLQRRPRAVQLGVTLLEAARELVDLSPEAAIRSHISACEALLSIDHPLDSNARSTLDKRLELSVCI